MERHVVSLRTGSRHPLWMRLAPSPRWLHGRVTRKLPRR